MLVIWCVMYLLLKPVPVLRLLFRLLEEQQTATPAKPILRLCGEKGQGVAFIRPYQMIFAGVSAPSCWLRSAISLACVLPKWQYWPHKRLSLPFCLIGTMPRHCQTSIFKWSWRGKVCIGGKKTWADIFLKPCWRAFVRPPHNGLYSFPFSAAKVNVLNLALCFDQKI